MVKWLSQYGALPKSQVIRMLQKPRSTAEKILRNLRRQMLVSDISGGYYIGTDPMSKPDQRTILSIWVLLKFIEQVDPMYPGEYLLPSKLTSDIGTATDIMESLDGSQKAISLTIGSFAQGLSGKLETGDIISVIVYSQKDGFAYTPPELQYIKVITSTTSTGVDKANIKDTTQPVTVTLLVNQAQAELLAQYEKSASMHFALEYRGDQTVAQKYLDRQNEYFKSGGEGQ